MQDLVNKTQRKIIEESLKLFMEKGYEETTIQDIINAVGMSKGAIYHYFKSKEDIFDAIWSTCFDENNVYDSIFNDKTQTGLAKVENVFVLNLQDTSKQKVDKFALPYIKNPKFLARSLKITYETSTQFLQSLIEQGIEDGSIKTKYPSELASSLSLLTNFWINPAVYEGTKEEVLKRCEFLCDLTENLGLSMNRQKILTALGSYLEAVF
ncbi:MAG: TetR/AcrR family transcriptional regulator [Anaerovoracaceae bacterium]